MFQLSHVFEASRPTSARFGFPVVIAPEGAVPDEPTTVYGVPAAGLSVGFSAGASIAQAAVVEQGLRAPTPSSRAAGVLLENARELRETMETVRRNDATGLLRLIFMCSVVFFIFCFIFRFRPYRACSSRCHVSW